MLRRIDLRGRRDLDPVGLAAVLPRAEVDVAVAVEQIRPVVEAVRDRGLPAVLEATERFDQVTLTDLRVPAEALQQALAALDPAVRAALEEAIARNRTVSTAQLRQDEVVAWSTARPSPSAGCPSAGSGCTSRAAGSPTRPRSS